MHGAEVDNCLDCWTASRIVRNPRICLAHGLRSQLYKIMLTAEQL